MGGKRKNEGDHTPTKNEKKERTSDLPEEVYNTVDSIEEQPMLVSENNNGIPSESVIDSTEILQNMLSQIEEIAKNLKTMAKSKDTEKMISETLSELSKTFKTREEGKKKTRNKSTKDITDQRQILESFYRLPGNADNRKYIKIEFESELKRTVNPFEVHRQLSTIVKTQLNNIFSINQRSLIACVEIDSQLAKEELLKLTTISGKICKITLYDPFNHSRGLIYLRDLNLDEGSLSELSEWLKEKHQTLINVEYAPFIKPKNPDTKAFILTYESRIVPHSIYLPGLSGDTKIYPFNNKPMRCQKCQAYGHTAKKCRSGKVICGWCSSEGHQILNCDVPSAKCLHCEGNHRPGSRDCSRQIRECEVLRIQEENRVSFKRAIQIEKGEEATSTTTYQPLPEVFTIHMTPTDKIKLKPWRAEKYIRDFLGDSPEDFRSINNSTFTIKTKTNEQHQKIQTLKKIDELPVEIRKGNNNLRPRGIIYICDYDVSDFESYKAQLIKTLPISDVLRASWIRSKNPKATPLLLIFNKPDVPTFVSIPGEQALTKVYEYKNRPQLCKNCLAFGHSVKNCSSPKVCAKCDTSGHSIEECESEEDVCHHCSGKHITGTRNCREYRKEEEIVAVQQRQGLPRTQAIAYLERQNPNFSHMNYRAAVITRPPPTDTIDMIRIRTELRNSETKAPNSQIYTSAPNQDTTIAVLQSPHSGRIYEDIITINHNTTKPPDTPDVFEDDEAATHKIFNEKQNEPSTKQQPQDTSEDRDHYETQLKHSKRAHKSKEKHNNRSSRKERKNSYKSNDRSRSHNSHRRNRR